MLNFLDDNLTSFCWFADNADGYQTLISLMAAWGTACDSCCCWCWCWWWWPMNVCCWMSDCGDGLALLLRIGGFGGIFMVLLPLFLFIPHIVAVGPINIAFPFGWNILLCLASKNKLNGTNLSKLCNFYWIWVLKEGLSKERIGAYHYEFQLE